MNRRFRHHYLLAGLALLLSACVAGERVETTIQRTWPAAGINSVRVDGVDGNLRVESGKTDEIRLIARVRSRGIPRLKEKENGGFFQTTISDGTLRIGQKKAKVRVSFPFASRVRLQIDYSLEVPERIALDLQTINGKIATRGIAGEAKMSSVNGTIDAEVLGGNDLAASTVNGHIRARFMREFKGATMKTVNGGVEAYLPASASFTCNLSQVNGDFEASFPLSIHSHPGSRRVSGEVNGGRYELRITTVNGDVEVDRFGVEVPEVPEVPEQPEVPEPPAPIT
jgi:hypothetical protein